MQNKRVASFAEAVADIPDGAKIMIAGFGPGTPYNLMRALLDQGAKNLHIITNAAGAGSGAAGDPDITTSMTLIENRRVAKATMSFTASTRASNRTALEEQNDAGEIIAELLPQGTLAERIRAGGAGIPAFYTPAAIGTELAEGRETRVFNGREYLLEEALTADYAFVRAWRADEFGNLVFRLAQRNFNPLMATAARITIAEVEEIVPIGTFEPDQVHTSGIYVKRLALIGPNDVVHVSRPFVRPNSPAGAGT